MVTTQGTETKHKVIDKVIPFIPEGEFYFTKGVEAFQKRRFDHALKWLQKAVEISPEEALFHCQLSIVHTEMGSFHTSNGILTDLMAKNGDSCADCYYLMANNFAHLNLFEEAEKYIKLYCEKAPEGEFIEEAEGLLRFVQLNDVAEENWFLDEEDEILAYREAIFEHLGRQEWGKARASLEDMIALFPEEIEVKHHYTEALFFKGNRDEALRLENEWLEENPHSLFSHANLAIFYHELQETGKCQAHIGVIKNVYPICEQQNLRIATALARTGSYKEAMLRFRSLPKFQVSDDASYYRWYSISAYRTGEPARALALWEEGCKRHPSMSQWDGPWV